MTNLRVMLDTHDRRTLLAQQRDKVDKRVASLTKKILRVVTAAFVYPSRLIEISIWLRVA